MSVLVFPNNPVNGQLYPPSLIPGVNQYRWNAATFSWELVYPPATSQPGPEISTESFTTELLAAGETQEFWLELGTFFSLISVMVTALSEDGWLRVYTTEEAMIADTRVVPGSPFPSPNSGFLLEVVTSPSEPEITFLPVPEIYSEAGLFFKFTNQSAISEVFTIEVSYITNIPRDCDYLPFGCSAFVNTDCVTNFVTPTGSLSGSTPRLQYSGGTTLLAEANNSYSGSVVGGTGSMGGFSLTRGALGEVISVAISGGSGYEIGDFLTILGSDIGGLDIVDNLTIVLDRENGMAVTGAWEGCSNIEFFPQLTLKQGINFENCWKDCGNLEHFPAAMFDDCMATNFYNSWYGCSLNQQSVDNILVSLDSAGQNDGYVSLDGGTSATPGLNGLAAKASLESKGWTVNINTVIYIYCTPEYPLLPVTYPPYSCNTVVNTSGVTDFSGAWSSCYSIINFPCVDASSVTSFNGAWSYCYYMETFPTLDASSVTDFGYAWSLNYNLNSFPLINSGSGTDFNSSWRYCTSLTSFPAIDVSMGSNFYQCWQGCSGITSFPTLDTSFGYTFWSAWEGCSGLSNFPLLDVSSGTYFGYTWKGCSGLTSFPTLDTSLGVAFNYAWRDCTGLTSFPALDTGSGQYFQGAWDNCTGLTSFPSLDTSSGVNFFGTWASCTGLTSFPAIDTSLGQSFSGAWLSCIGLTSFPPLNFNSGTDFSNAWYNCSSLVSFPAGLFDSCSATNFSFAWYGCALSQTSVDNILVSLDTAGQNNGSVHVSQGTSSAPGAAGVAAKVSLQAKGWTVFTN